MSQILHRIMLNDKIYNKSLANNNSHVFGCSLQQHYTSPKKTNIFQCKTQTSLILIRLQLPWHFLCAESMIAASVVAINHSKNLKHLCFYAKDQAAKKLLNLMCISRAHRQSQIWSASQGTWFKCRWRRFRG